MEFPAGPDRIDAAWLGRALGPGDAADPIRSVRCETIGVGFGLDGTLARVVAEGASGRVRTVVAKWSAEKGAREARFYREVGPHLGIDVPALRASFVDGERSLLLLDEVAPARQGDAIAGATPEEALRLAAAAAAFHARFWASPEHPAIAWLPRWGRDPEGEARRTRELWPRCLERHGPRIGDRVRAASATLSDAVLAAHAALARTPVTLLHNDLHLDNVLWRPDGTPVVIDWAQASRGPAVVDVARLLVEGMSVETRRAVEGEFLGAYVEALAREGVRGYGREDLAADLGPALTLVLGAAVRCGGAEEEPDTAVPRVPVILENLVRNACAAWTDVRSSDPRR